MTAPLNSAPGAVAPGTSENEGRDPRPRWVPGTPYRPISIEQYEALRSYGDPVNTVIRHETERREAQEEADGLACPHPDCGAALGSPCFGSETRLNHPARGMAHWSAQSRKRGLYADLVEGTEPEPRAPRAAETYVPPPGLWTAGETMAFIGSVT